MSRRAWTVFFVLQLAGTLCYWAWPNIRSAVGPWVWAGSAFLLLPGNFASDWLTLHTLWGGTVGLRAIAVLDNVLAIAINAAVWAACAAVWRRIRGKTRTTGTGEEVPAPGGSVPRG